MKEFKFSKQGTPMGDVNVFMRIIGRIIYFKFNQSQYAQQVIQQMRNKGAIINVGRHGEWVRCNIFSNPELTLVKLGNREINLEEDTDEIVENKLAVFYTGMYSKSGFSLDE